MRRGLFITFEGTDGCGKSTQMKYLNEYLQEKGYDCIVTREPGGCPVAEKVREILLDNQNGSIKDMTEALLYAAARVQHIEEVILPALAEGKIVLCDRYLDSSVAYQGYGRQLGKQLILDINRYAVENCMPDKTFFMDFQPKKAFERMHNRQDLDRLEQAGDEFFDRVYRGFLQICEDDPRRVKIINASGSKWETRDIIKDLMDEVLNSWQA